MRVLDAAAPQITGGGGGGNTGSISAGTAVATLGLLSFADSNGLTFGINGQTITGSVAAAGGGLTNIRISAGTTSNLLSAVTFANGNGVSFGLNASTITGSIATSLTNINVSAGTTSNNLSAITFANANGVTFGLNGSTITASVTPGGGGNTGSISAGGVDATLGRVVFSDSNGVSFGVAGQTVTASTGPLAISDGAASSTYDNTLGFTRDIISQNVAFEITNGSIAARAYIGVGDNGGTGQAQTLHFINGNGVTFSTAGAGDDVTITASVAAAGGAQTGISGIEVSNTTYTSGTVTFRNANGISFGSSGANGVSASYTVPIVTNSSWTVSDNATSGTVARLAFTNVNGVTLSLSTGAGGSHTIVGSHNAITSQSTQFLAMTLGGNTAGTTTFHATNNASLFFNGGNNITLSGNGSTVTISAANQTVQTQPLSIFATSNTTQSSSGTMAANSLLFNGAGIASVGYSNGSVIISVPSGGGAGDGVVSMGMSTEGNTAGTTGTVSSGRFIFVGTGPISLSQSLNGQSGTLSIDGPATSSLVGATGLTVSTNGSTISVGEIPLSRWAPDVAITAAGSIQANSSVTLVPFRLEQAVAASQIQFAMSVSGATTTNNSSAGMQLSASVVIYTRNGSTLSSINSGSISFSNSGYTSNATGSFNGPRQLTLSFASATTMTAGEYWMAVHVSTVTTGQTNLAKSISMGVVPTWQSGFGVLNHFGSAMTNTRSPRMGLAIHSTGATRASIAFSDITGHSGNSASLANLWFALRNYTIW